MTEPNDEREARIARLRRQANSYAVMRGKWNAEWAADLNAAAAALEASRPSPVSVEAVVEEAGRFVREKHTEWHDVGVGIVQGSHYRSGFVAGARWTVARFALPAPVVTEEDERGPTHSRQEFEARRPNLITEYTHGRLSIECREDHSIEPDVDCIGWKMTSLESLADDLTLYGNTASDVARAVLNRDAVLVAALTPEAGQ